MDIFVERAGMPRSVDELGDLARASRERLVGRLRIGVIPTIALPLPSIIENLTRTYGPRYPCPGLTPRLLEESLRWSDRYRDCRAADLRTVLTRYLFEERFVLVASRQRGCPRECGRLARNALLLLEEGHCFRTRHCRFGSMQTARP